MGRMTVVIADTEEDFTVSLAEYLASVYGKKFRICAFTRRDQLETYLSGNGRADLLLVNPDMYAGLAPTNKAVQTVLLSETKGEAASAGMRSIFKYQHRGMLLNEILDALSEGIPAFGYIPGRKKTRMIAVYSPAGGAGKTAIAVACSALCSQNGLSTFYLGMESLPSAPFTPDQLMEQSMSGRSLSRVLYQIREKTCNLPLVLESCRYKDERTGVEYFAPPESPLDMEEMKPEETLELIRHFRALGRYDMVFIDMDSVFSSKTMALLEECDEIFMVVTKDASCIDKAKVFQAGLKKVFDGNDSAVREKCVMILNRCKAGEQEREYESLLESGPFTVIIPETNGLRGMDSLWDTGAAGSSFRHAIHCLVDKYLPVKSGGAP